MPRDGVAVARTHAIHVFDVSGGANRFAEIAGADGSLFAARWKFERARIPTANLSAGVLICRTAGTATVTRSSRGSSLRRRPSIGSISYVCPDTPAVWAVDGPCESCHVYLNYERLQECAERDSRARRGPIVRDLFATEDPWLKGYFQMLLSEFDAPDGARGDALFVTQAEQLLIHHLVQRHSSALADHEPSPGKRRTSPLCTVLLRRIEDYIDANLSRDISLRDLAAVACMSSGHFLRAFRAASGTTPYQYLLKRRLLRACDLLRSSRLPMTRVAHESGFRTASHLSSKFHASLGTTPSRYRAGAAFRPDRSL